MGCEIEWKYRATEKVQAALEAVYEFHTVAMETTYYDTPAGALAKRHWTLRRRLENGISVCTLKTPEGTLGRGEWELECDSIETAVPALCKLGCPGGLADLTAEGLHPVCGARFTRRAALVRLGDTAVELALDAGILFAGENSQPLCEIEVELKSGSVELAGAFATALAAQYGLASEPGSKFKRALALKER